MNDSLHSSRSFKDTKGQGQSSQGDPANGSESGGHEDSDKEGKGCCVMKKAKEAKKDITQQHGKSGQAERNSRQREPVGSQPSDVSNLADAAKDCHDFYEQDDSVAESSWFSKKWKRARRNLRHLRPSIHDSLKEIREKIVSPNRAFRPDDNVIQVWDVWMALLLLYTATVTPYYIVFIPIELNPLFWIDRVVDVCFIFDVVVQFFLAFERSPRLYITKKKIIAKHYLRKYFWIDIVAVFPYTLLAYGVQTMTYNSVVTQNLMPLLRMLLLLRLYRAQRVLHQFRVLSNLSYRNIKLLQWLFIYVFSNHWLGCLWRLIPILEHDPEGGWIAGSGFAGEDNWKIYMASMYWACMTTTTIGYGDITPATVWERLYAICAMLVGASLYAYVVGNICGVVASFRSTSNRFEEIMDQLRSLVRKYDIPRPLRARLRRYFRYHWWHRGIGEFKDLLKFMSPSLRQQVLMHAHSDYLKKVPSFAQCPRGFLAELAPCLTQEVYGPHESFTEKDQDGQEKIYIIVRGLVATSMGALLLSGSCLGEECLWLGNHAGNLAGRSEESSEPKLKGGELKDPSKGFTVMTLTYTVALSIHREDVLDALEKFPEARKAIDRARVRRLAWEGIRAFTRALAAVQKQQADGEIGAHSLLSLEGHDNRLQNTYESVLAHVVEGKLRLGDTNIERLGSETIEAAVKIQRAFRRWLARKKATKERLAIVKLQALIRGRQARRDYRQATLQNFAKALASAERPQREVSANGLLTSMSVFALSEMIVSLQAEILAGLRAIVNDFHESTSVLTARVTSLSHTVRSRLGNLDESLGRLREELESRTKKPARYSTET